MSLKIQKALSMMLICILTVCLFAGCGKKKVESSSREPLVDVNIAVLKGPSALGMLKLMEQSDNGTARNNYHFNIRTAADQIAPEIIKGTLDIAAVPTNLAATLYQKTNGGVSILAVNTLGALSLLTNGEDITSISQLRGKTIYSTGKGSTPEYAINYILEKNGLKVGTDVFVNYKAEHAELATMVISGDVRISVLPQPFVTNVTMKNKDVKIALDLSEEWEKLPDSNGSKLVMGCLVVRNEFLEKNREAVNTFLQEYQLSSNQANEKLDVTANLAEHYDVMPAQVVGLALPKCNILYMDGAEMKQNVSAYLNVLFNANPASVGGALPKDDFYYAK